MRAKSSLNDKWQKRKSRDEREINLYLRKTEFTLSYIGVKFAMSTSDLKLAVLFNLQVNCFSVSVLVSIESKNFHKLMSNLKKKVNRSCDLIPWYISVDNFVQ